jgi:DNA-binding Lrp family transcriptional regulator
VITAIVLINCATDAIPEVAENLANIDGVSEVYSVAGSIDLIAVVRVARFEAIG